MKITMRSLALAFFGVCGITLGVTATASAAQWQAERAFDTRVPAEKTGSLLLRADNGDVHLVAADTNEIAIHIRIRTHDQNTLDTLVNSAATPHRNGNNVEFDARCGQKSFFGYTNSCTIDQTITYPRDMAVDVESMNGDVTVTSARGDVAVHMTNGDIIVKDATRSLSLSTRHGDVVASIAQTWNGKSIALAVSEGDVVLQVPRNFDAYLDASVRVGNIKNNANIPATASKASSIAIRASTVIGDVTIKN